MDRNHPHNRRRARAIAISDTTQPRRVAAMRMLLLLAGLAGLAEAALLVHRLWAVHA